MSIEGHTWGARGSYIGEVKFALHIRSYYRDVVAPAVAALHQLILSTEAKEDEEPSGGWVFLLEDQKDLLRSTIEAFCLALQSHWERQFRRYMHGVRPPEATNKPVSKMDWQELQEVFRNWRGIDLRAFDSFAWLDLLQTVGNACRHGSGHAAARLYQQHPQIWPSWVREPIAFPWDSFVPEPTAPPGFESALVPEIWLQRFTEAIASFWEDVEYINIASIQIRAPIIEKHMDEIRANWPSRINTITYD